MNERRPECRPTPAGPMLRAHARGCVDRACEGCQPCPETHCQGRPGGRCARHVPAGVLTCGRCLAATRRDIAMVSTLAALMLPEAIAQGLHSDAASLAGPAPHPVVLEARRELVRADVVHAELAAAFGDPSAHVPDDFAAILDTDRHHPFAVLGRWHMRTRELLGLPLAPVEQLTVSGSAGYLDRMLDTVAQHPDGGFATMAGEVRACRTHLESVVHNSHAPERGAPCPRCATEDTRGPALVKSYDDDDRTGAGDSWTCPRDPAHTWREAAYRLEVWARYVQHADRLTATEIEREYRVRPGTLRKWAHEGKVAKRGRDAAGRRLYDVADTIAQRDRTSAAETP